MPWPPVVPPATRTDATAQLAVHAADHNQAAQALTDIVNQVNTKTTSRLVSGSSTSGAGGISADTDVVNTGNVTTLAGHRYKITGMLVGSMVGAGGNLFVKLTDGTTQLAAAIVTVAAASYASPTVVVEVTPTPGVHNYRLRASTSGGGATFTLAGAAGQPHTLIVEDMGT